MFEHKATFICNSGILVELKLTFSPGLEIRFKDIPAQWAKIRHGLDIFRIRSKCVGLSNGEA